MIEQNDDYFDNIKNQEQSILKNIPNKNMENCFTTVFEDVRHERSLILKLTLTDPDILKQIGLPGYEIKIIKNLY